MRVYFLLGLGLGLVACQTRPDGRGIGRPSADVSDHVERLPLAITEVFLATGAAGDRFVEIALDPSCDGDTCGTVDLGGLSLCVGPRCETIAGTVGMDQRVALGIPAGDPPEPSPTVGEAALIDGEGVVHAYLAWGLPPGSLDGPRAAGAIESGALASILDPFYVPTALPMPDGVAAAAEGGVPGCALASEGAAGTLDPTLCADTTPPLHLTGTQAAAAEGADSWVDLHYGGPSPVELFGTSICHPGGCGMLPPGSGLGPDQTARVHFGGATEQELIGDPDLNWDLAALPAIPVAGEVTLWLPGQQSPLAGVFLCGGHAGTAPTAVIDRLSRLTPETFAIRNLGAEAIDLTTTTLTVTHRDGTSWSQTLAMESTLGPGQTVSFELDPNDDGCVEPDPRCLVNPDAIVPPEGEASLRAEDGTLVTYLQWGTYEGGSWENPRREAIDAGLWPAHGCSAVAIADGQSLVLDPAATEAIPSLYGLQ